MSAFPAALVAAAATTAIAGITKLVADELETAEDIATVEMDGIECKMQEKSFENQTTQMTAKERVEQYRQKVVDVYKKGGEECERLRVESQAEYMKLKEFYTHKLREQDRLLEEFSGKMMDLRIEGRQKMEDIVLDKESKKVKIEEKYEDRIKLKTSELDKLKGKALEIQKQCIEKEDLRESALRDTESRLDEKHEKSLTRKDRCLDACIGVMYSMMSRAEELAERRVREAQFMYLQERINILGLEQARIGTLPRVQCVTSETDRSLSTQFYERLSPLGRTNESESQDNLEN